MKIIQKLALALALASAVSSSALAQVATVTPSEITTAGVNLTTGLTSAPSTTIYVNNDGNIILVIKTGSTAISATARVNGSQNCPAGYGCYTPSDAAINVPANTVMLMGPFPQGRYNIPGYDTIKVDFTSISQVSATPVHFVD